MSMKNNMRVLIECVKVQCCLRLLYCRLFGSVYLKYQNNKWFQLLNIYVVMLLKVPGIWKGH